MAGIPDRFGEGHSGLAPGGAQGTPDLATILKSMNLQGAGIVSAAALDWQSPIAVAGDQAVMPSAGLVVAVDGITGTATGPKAMRSAGAVAAGQVLVTYDGDGVATLAFAGADALSECAVTFIPAGEGLLP